MKIHDTITKQLNKQKTYQKPTESITEDEWCVAYESSVGHKMPEPGFKTVVEISKTFSLSTRQTLSIRQTREIIARMMRAGVLERRTFLTADVSGARRPLPMWRPVKKK